jgi:hypothetical protein
MLLPEAAVPVGAGARGSNDTGIDYFVNSFLNFNHRIANLEGCFFGVEMLSSNSRF